jgi:hypothetical protein
MRVADARYFYDGFGIPGEQGDLIWVGAAREPARVVARDIEQNTLTLDRNLTWEADEPVTLPYAGDAPDHGAYERGAGEGWHIEPVIPGGHAPADDGERHRAHRGSQLRAGGP